MLTEPVATTMLAKVQDSSESGACLNAYRSRSHFKSYSLIKRSKTAYGGSLIGMQAYEMMIIVGDDS